MVLIVTSILPDKIWEITDKKDLLNNEEFFILQQNIKSTTDYANMSWVYRNLCQCRLYYERDAYLYLLSDNDYLNSNIRKVVGGYVWIVSINKVPVDSSDIYKHPEGWIPKEKMRFTTMDIERAFLSLKSCKVSTGVAVVKV